MAWLEAIVSLASDNIDANGRDGAQHSSNPCNNADQLAKYKMTGVSAPTSGLFYGQGRDLAFLDEVICTDAVVIEATIQPPSTLRAVSTPKSSSSQ